MIYILENFGIWAPGIIAILGGAVFAFWTVSLSHSEQGEEEKAGLKEIKGKKEERRENKVKEAA